MFYTHGCIFCGSNAHNSSLEITIQRFILSKAHFKSVLWVKTHWFWRQDDFLSYIDFSSKLIMYGLLLVLRQHFLNVYVVFRIRRSIQNTLEIKFDVARTEYVCERSGARLKISSFLMKWIKSEEINFLMYFNGFQCSCQCALRWALMFSGS